MEQYFTNNPSSASKERKIVFEVCGYHMELLTDNGVFSKDRLDEGTFAFLKVLLPLNLSGNILDVGCGYGPIGLTMAVANPNATVTLADVNNRAVELTKKNAISLGLSQRVTILQSDIYENIEGPFDQIVVNPPIRAGKKVTYAMYEGATRLLKNGGSLYLVIRKAQGAPSASKYIESLFGNIYLLKKEKGYYVYKATKNN